MRGILKSTYMSGWASSLSNTYFLAFLTLRIFIKIILITKAQCTSKLTNEIRSFQATTGFLGNFIEECLDIILIEILTKDPVERWFKKFC